MAARAVACSPAKTLDMGLKIGVASERLAALEYSTPHNYIRECTAASLVQPFPLLPLLPRPCPLPLIGVRPNALPLRVSLPLALSSPASPLWLPVNFS